MMINSYRMQAERRASLSRGPAVSVARVAVKSPPLELPPWGYGSGRTVTQPTTINTIRRPRTRSVSPAKQTYSCCETGAAVSRPAASSIVSKQNHVGSEAGEMHAVSMKTTEHTAVKLAEAAGKKYAPMDTGLNAAARAIATEHPHDWQLSGKHVGEAEVLGGGPVVTSSSMETWTTYEDNSTSPRVQSTASSPHSVVTPEIDSAVDTPLSLACTGPTSSLRPVSPPSAPDAVPNTTPPGSPVNRTMNAITGVIQPSSATSDVNADQKSTTATTRRTADEPLMGVAVSPSGSVGRSDAQKSAVQSEDGSSSVGGVTCAVKSPNHSSKGVCSRRAETRSDPEKKVPTMPKENVKDKSNLMVGLVKVKSRHTGLMIDCPILETIYQSENVMESPVTAVRKSSSHKVVLIKAVVPRWAWNGRGDSTPTSSSRASQSSSHATDRSAVANGVNKRRSQVSVDTQTSDTLLVARSPRLSDTELSVRRASSEHQSTPSSPLTVVDLYKCVPAAEDNAPLLPSPKLSAHNKITTITTKNFPLTPTGSYGTVSPPDNRITASPKLGGLSMSSARSKGRIRTETATFVSPVPASVTGIRPEDHAAAGQLRSMSMDQDSLAEDTIGNLKLDLPFSSSDNSSDNDSVAPAGDKAVKRPLSEPLNRSSSSDDDDDDVECDRKPHSPSCQSVPAADWSCNATVGDRSNYASVHVMNATDYIDGDAVCMNQLPELTSIAGQAGSKPPTPTDSCNAPRSKRQPFSSQYDTSMKLLADNLCGRKRSPCVWRSATSHDSRRETSQGHSLTAENSLQYDDSYHDEAAAGMNRSVIHRMSRSESTVSNHSQSTFFDYDVAEDTPLGRGARTTHTSPPPNWTSTTVANSRSPSDTAPLSVDTEYSSCPDHRPHHSYHFSTGDDVDTEAVQSRQSYRRTRTLHTNKHRAAESKSPVPDSHQHYSRSASGNKRSTERRQKCSAKQADRKEMAHSSQSTGSLGAARSGERRASGHRQHTVSAGRHEPDVRHRSRDKSAERRHASIANKRCRSLRDDGRRRQSAYDGQATSQDAILRRSTKPTTANRNARCTAQPVHASASTSGSTSRRRALRPATGNARRTECLADECISSQQDDVKKCHTHQLPLPSGPPIFYQCRPSFIYCSPVSGKPFPPPISDRFPPGCYDNLTVAAATSSDGESVKYVLVQRQLDADYVDVQQTLTNNHRPPPPDVPPTRGGQEHAQHRRPHAAAAANARSDPAQHNSEKTRKRMNVTATPYIDSHGRATMDRPLWKHF